MRALLAVACSAWLLTGCSAPETQGTDQVEAVNMFPPIPSIDYQILYPDRDADKIEKILSYLEKAQSAEEDELQMGRHSPVLQVAWKDGTSVSIQFAWTCRSTDANSTQCSASPDRAMLSGEEYPESKFVQSPELYDILMHPRDWFSEVQKVTAPQSVRIGETFTVSGDAWRSEKVTLQLTAQQNVLWSVEVPVDHGHYTQTTQLHDGIKPGEYQLDVKGDDGTRGSSLKVTE